MGRIDRRHNDSDTPGRGERVHVGDAGKPPLEFLKLDASGVVDPGMENDSPSRLRTVTRCVCELIDWDVRFDIIDNIPGRGVPTRDVDAAGPIDWSVILQERRTRLSWIACRRV